MKRTFIFYFSIISKAHHIFKEKIEIENDNYSFALDTAIGQIYHKYAKPLTITLENLQIKINE